MYNETLEGLFKKAPTIDEDSLESKIKRKSSEIISEKDQVTVLRVFALAGSLMSVPFAIVQIGKIVDYFFVEGSVFFKLAWMMGSILFALAFVRLIVYLFELLGKYRYQFKDEKKQIVELFNLLTERPYEIRLEYQNHKDGMGRRFKVVVEKNEVQSSFVVKEKSENFTAYFDLQSIFNPKANGKTSREARLELVNFVDHLAHKANQWNKPPAVKKIVEK